jgi:nucleoside-triphosphatase THEP1
MLISNPYECAMEFAVNTDRDIFITGKAGTGKTTFLHKFRKETEVKMHLQMLMRTVVSGKLKQTVQWSR